MELLDNDFFGQCAFFATDDETVDAFRNGRALVGQGVAFGRTVGLQLVDQDASHVVELDVDLAGEVLKVEGHRAVVGIGCHNEGGL